MLDLFFRCLDESTAHSLRSVDVASTPGPGNQADDRNERQDDGGNGIDVCDATNTPNRSTIAVDNPQMPWQDSTSTDLMAPNDWYGLFNFTDDYMDVLGTSSQPDSLNLQSLEFLYRFL